MSDTRPVWLTEEEAELAGWLYSRWDAAPADPLMAAYAAAEEFLDSGGGPRELFFERVLRALGMPDA